MTDRQLTFEENDIAHMVNSAYDRLCAGEFGEAAKLLERALELDVEYEGVAATLTGVRFWAERRQRLEEIRGSADRAAYLLDQWAAFRAFAARVEDLPERCYQDIKHYIHATALAHLLQSSSTEASVTGSSPYARPSAQTRRLFLIGHCSKAMGDFANAIGYLEHASRLDRDWAPLLAELADCYSLINETRAAKVFFREAFYLGAASITIERLESPLIHRLVAALMDSRVTEHISEWVPVYGTLLGAFNITRELKPLEYGKLLQSIFELEGSLGVKLSTNAVTVAAPQDSGERSALVPRLINRYFWLIEHYLATHEERTKVDDILRRLKALDLSVYQHYIA